VAVAFAAAIIQVSYWPLSWTQTLPRAVSTAIGSVGIFILYLFSYALRAPLELHRKCTAEHAGRLADLEAKYESQLRELRSRNADLMRQLELPKMEGKITAGSAEGVSSNFARPGPPDILMDTEDIRIGLHICIANTHRVPATVTCQLKVRTQSGKEFGAEAEANPDVRRFPPFDQQTPIDFGAPRSGYLFYRVRGRRLDQLKGAINVLTVTDGTGQTTTFESPA